MRTRDVGGDRQAEPHARRGVLIARDVEPRERFERFLTVGLRDARPVPRR